MNTMINLNELATVSGGNDILAIDVQDTVLPTMVNQPVSLDVLDFTEPGQFLLLSGCKGSKRSGRTYRPIDGRA